MKEALTGKYHHKGYQPVQQIIRNHYLHVFVILKVDIDIGGIKVNADFGPPLDFRVLINGKIQLIF